MRRRRRPAGASRWPRRSSPGRWAPGVALCALAVATLSSCVPLFVPPVPTDMLTPAPVWRVAGDTSLVVLDDAGADAASLRLEVRFDEVPTAAWVAVQWFGPAGGERASASHWVTPDDVGQTLTWDTPPDLELAPGGWRAVVSVGDRLLRQLDVDVGREAPTP